MLECLQVRIVCPRAFREALKRKRTRIKEVARGRSQDLSHLDTYREKREAFELLTAISRKQKALGVGKRGRRSMIESRRGERWSTGCNVVYEV